MRKQSDYAQRVGAEVRAELARQRMSQVTLAARMNVSQAYVGRRIAGEPAFNIGELDLIARILEVPITHLLPQQQAAQKAG